MPRKLFHSLFDGRSSRPSRIPVGNRARRASGFTLIEILIVLVIVGVGLSVGLPRIQYIIVRQRVDRAAQVVAADIRSAFTSAARGRVPVRISIPSGSARYNVVNRATGETIVSRDLGSGDVAVQTVSGTAVTVDVYPNGVATTLDTVTVTSAGYSRKISVSRVGFVRLLPSGS